MGRMQCKSIRNDRTRMFSPVSCEHKQIVAGSMSNKPENIQPHMSMFLAVIKRLQAWGFVLFTQRLKVAPIKEAINASAFMKIFKPN